MIHLLITKEKTHLYYQEQRRTNELTTHSEHWRVVSFIQIIYTPLKYVIQKNLLANVIHWSQKLLKLVAFVGYFCWLVRNKWMRTNAGEKPGF